MEKELKDIITERVSSLLKKVESNHGRINMRDFKEIVNKNEGKYKLFYHPIYKNKNIEYFNEEENTDFLVFETNLVYIDYSDNLFTFHKIDEDEKLVKVDLDNQEILDEEKEELDNENEIMSKNDLITINYFPLSISHSNLTICNDQNFAQVLSTEFISQTLQIFSITKNNSLVCGYDSNGAGCLINHLHFEILFMDDIDGLTSLPIEKEEKKLIFSTKLQHKDVEEISTFNDNTEIFFYELSSPILCFRIEVQETNEISTLNELENDSNFQTSISHFSNVILTILTDNLIPHNLVIMDKGKTFYIFPRQFSINETPINSCWNDLCGLITFKEKEIYSEINEEKINSILKEKVSLEEEAFLDIKEKVINQFEEIYIISK